MFIRYQDDIVSAFGDEIITGFARSAASKHYNIFRVFFEALSD